MSVFFVELERRERTGRITGWRSGSLLTQTSGVAQLDVWRMNARYWECRWLCPHGPSRPCALWPCRCSRSSTPASTAEARKAPAHNA